MLFCWRFWIQPKINYPSFDTLAVIPMGKPPHHFSLSNSVGKTQFIIRIYLCSVQEKQKFSGGSIAVGSVIVRNLDDKELVFVHTDSYAVL